MTDAPPLLSPDDKETTSNNVNDMFLAAMEQKTTRARLSTLEPLADTMATFIDKVLGFLPPEHQDIGSALVNANAEYRSITKTL